MLKKILRILMYCALGLIAFLATAAALLFYFVYSPSPERPQLSGILDKQTLPVGGLQRTYRTYVPRGLPAGSPLLFVMHGSGENAAQIAMETGYGFERLADQQQFAVVYPNSYSDDWNDCGRIGDYSVHGQEVDDVGFLVALANKLVSKLDLDRNRVFATGVSAGGFMSLRLALEASGTFRAVAGVAANVQTADNFKCKPAGAGSSVLIIDGTEDPLVPFKGGEVNLLGLFYKSGRVQSAGSSAQYFARLNHLDAAPISQSATVDGVMIHTTDWRENTRVEVELIAIQGGGHGLPQPIYRRPRLLGPSPMAPNGPELIWAFFARQTP